MAETKGKCANCGKAITLEPDANGGERWYHEGDQVRCEGGRTSATPAAKAAADEKSDDEKGVK